MSFEQQGAPAQALEKRVKNLTMWSRHSRGEARKHTEKADVYGILAQFGQMCGEAEGDVFYGQPSDDIEGGYFLRLNGRSYFAYTEDFDWHGKHGGHTDQSTGETTEVTGDFHVENWVVDLDSGDFNVYRQWREIEENPISGIHCLIGTYLLTSEERFKDAAQATLQDMVSGTPVGELFSDKSSTMRQKAIQTYNEVYEAGDIQG